MLAGHLSVTRSYDRFMYPHRFLTPHFLTEEKRGELMASSHIKMLARTKDLSEILKAGQDSELLSFLSDASDVVSGIFAP